MSQAIEFFDRLTVDAYSASKELLKFLEQEFQALKQNDLNILPKLAEQKFELYKILDTNYQQRQELITNNGHQHNPDGIQAFITSLPEQTRHIQKKQWQQLVDTLAKCKRQNQVNGQIISAGSHAFKQLEKIIFQNGEDAPEIYNQAGVKESNNNSRGISEA